MKLYTKIRQNIFPSPQNFHALKYTPHKILHISHALLVIIFLIIPATESIFSVGQKFTKLKIKNIQSHRAGNICVCSQLFQEDLQYFFLFMDSKICNIYFHNFTQVRRCQKCSKTAQLHVSSCKFVPPENYFKQRELHIGYKLPMQQAGLTKERGTSVQIASLRESWTAQGSTTEMLNVLWITRRILLVCSM
jgi:hypothetical protein